MWGAELSLHDVIPCQAMRCDDVLGTRHRCRIFEDVQCAAAVAAAAAAGMALLRSKHAPSCSMAVLVPKTKKKTKTNKNKHHTYVLPSRKLQIGAILVLPFPGPFFCFFKILVEYLCSERRKVGSGDRRAQRGFCLSREPPSLPSPARWFVVVWRCVCFLARPGHDFFRELRDENGRNKMPIRASATRL